MKDISCHAWLMFTFFMVLSGVHSLAQNLQYTRSAAIRDIDSLSNVLKTTQGLDRCKLFLEFPSRYVALEDYAKALETSEQGRECALQLADSFYIVRSTRYMAQLFDLMNEQPRAIETYQSILPMAKRNKFDEEERRILNSLANIYSSQGVYDKALSYHLESLVIREREGDLDAISVAYTNIGLIYRHVKNDKKALECFKKALILEKESGGTHGLGELYIDMAESEMDLGNFTAAWSYLGEAIKICKGNCEKPVIADLKETLGKAYWHQGETTKAKNHFDESLKMAIAIDHKRLIAQNRNWLGNVALREGDYDAAREFFIKAEDVAREFKLRETLMDVYKNLSSVHFQMGTFKQAALYQNKYSALRDSIYKNQVINLINLQNEYEQRENLKKIEEKDQVLKLNELSLQRKTNQTYFLVAVVIMIVLFSSVLFIWHRRLQIAHKKEQEQNLLLIELNATKDKFFSIISHDLKGPIYSLTHFSRLLKSTSQSKEDIQLLTSKFDIELRNVLSLLENLLQWARAQGKMVDFKPELFDIRELISHNKSLLEERAKSKGIRIKTNGSPSVMVAAHKHSINTVLYNLISNAVKFTHPDGEVEVDARIAEGAAIVSVRDTGVGIKAELIKRLFKIDDVHSSPGTADEVGTGLGLILCKEFVEKNNGKIWVESEPGKGSLFQFTLPV